jgi:hypothetical protein
VSASPFDDRIANSLQNHFDMNNTIALICLGIFVALTTPVQLNSQTVAEEQRLLLTKRTASWCPNCGTWGWTLFKNLIEDNAQKAVLIAAHYDGQLAVPAAADLTDNFGGFYQPRFFLNETDVNASSGNIASIQNSIQNQVNAAFATGPVVNAGFAPIWMDGALEVAARVKFFQEAQGEFYLGIYLVENDVTAYQAGIGNNAVHQKLFRAAFSDETWGQLIVDGTAQAGQEFTLNFSHPLDELQGNYEVVGIIWKKENSKYLPVNAWSTNQIGTSTGIALQARQVGLSTTPVPASDRVTIQVSLSAALDEAVLEVIELSTGRTVKELHQGGLKAGGHRWETNREDLGGSGVYLVRLISAGQYQTTSRIVIQ